MSRTDLTDALARCLGHEYVERVEHPERDDDRGSVVARPGTIDEVSAVVTLAHEHGWKLQVRGGGTRQPAATHATADVVIALDRLHRLIDHQPENLVAAVECGMPFAGFQRQLASAGQCLPLDPLCAAGSTVGGVLATNDHGSLRLRHGTARDRLIGAEIVRHDGRVIRTGGMVVKNVSGYDLGKLHIGSHGTLGILVRANVKVSPLPAATALIRADALADRVAVWRTVQALRRVPVPVASALWIASALWLGLESEAESIDAHVATTREQLASAGFGQVDKANGDDLAPAVAPLRADSPWRIRLHAPPAKLAQFLPVADCAWVVDSSTAWAWSDGDEFDLAALRACAAGLDGTVIVERTPRTDVVRHAPTADVAAMMARLKQSLDPTATFPTLATS